MMIFLAVSFIIPCFPFHSLSHSLHFSPQSSYSTFVLHPYITITTTLPAFWSSNLSRVYLLSPLLFLITSSTFLLISYSVFPAPLQLLSSPMTLYFLLQWCCGGVDVPTVLVLVPSVALPLPRLLPHHAHRTQQGSYVRHTCSHFIRHISWLGCPSSNRWCVHFMFPSLRGTCRRYNAIIS